MRKIVWVGPIIYFMAVSQLFAMAVEERAFREELETRAEMEVSYDAHLGNWCHSPLLQSAYSKRGI